MSKNAHLFAALAALFPGDHIPYVAPINKHTSQSASDRLAQIDAAERKRNRKKAKRRAQ